MSDKYEVRKYLTGKIGDKYLVPLIGVWDRLEDIDFYKLPNQFVLKCTHDCGSVVICRDKTDFNIKTAKEKLFFGLKRSQYLKYREWAYKDIKPRIIAEKFMGENIIDYKFYTFNGKVKVIIVIFDRFISQKKNIYTTDWQYIPCSMDVPTFPDHIIEKPAKLNEMIEIAENLSKGINFLRVDLYYIDNKIYNGELTFYPQGGCVKFSPIEYDEIFGSWLNLPIK